MSNLLSNYHTKNSTSYNPSSFDHILHYGNPVVLPLQVWTIISNFYVIALVYVFTRLYRAFCALSFSILRSDNYDWDVDQLRAIYRNAEQSLDALLNLRTLMPWKYERGRSDDARTISSILIWKVAAFAALILTALSPLAISLVPIAPGRLGDADSCVGWATPFYHNVSLQSVAFQMFSRRATLSLNTADANYRLKVENVQNNTIGLRPDETYTIGNECPSYADPNVCDPSNPFFLNTTFWLTPGEARVGGINEERIRVGFHNTCYKARLLTTTLEKDATGNVTLGLMYGRQDNNPYTDILSSYVSLRDSYKWAVFPNPGLPDYYKNLPDYLKTPKELRSIINLAWRPNKTLEHYGDVTLMFFQGSGPWSFASTDPLFETGNSSFNFGDKSNQGVDRLPLFKAKQLAVPIVCNTSFEVCHAGSGSSNTCQQVGSAGGFWNFTQDYKGPAVARGYLETLALDNAYPLLGIIPQLSPSIKAAQTLYQGVQTCNTCTSAATEMMRLLLAARSWLASSPSRVAQGNSSADLSDLSGPNRGFSVDGSIGLNFFTSPEQEKMCSHTLLDDKDKLVISANLLVGVAAIIIGVLLVFVLGAFIHKNLWVIGGAFDLRWRSYGFLQLHRMLAEETSGQRWKGAVNAFPEGPEINPVTGSGKVSALRVIKVGEPGGEDGLHMAGGNGTYTHVHSEDMDDTKERVRPSQGGPGYYTVVRQDSAGGSELSNKNLPRRKEFSHK